MQTILELQIKGKTKTQKKQLENVRQKSTNGSFIRSRTQ